MTKMVIVAGKEFALKSYPFGEFMEAFPCQISDLSDLVEACKTGRAGAAALHIENTVFKDRKMRVLRDFNTFEVFGTCLQGSLLA